MSMRFESNSYKKLGQVVRKWIASRKSQPLVSCAFQSTASTHGMMRHHHKRRFRSNSKTPIWIQTVSFFQASWLYTPPSYYQAVRSPTSASPNVLDFFISPTVASTTSPPLAMISGSVLRKNSNR